MPPIAKVVFIITLLQTYSSQTCQELDCPICCVEDSSSSYCSTDTLTCQLDPDTDYGLLIKTVIIIAGFLIGIPILLVILEFLVLKRIACLKMSVCEILVNGICLCKCFRKKKDNPKTSKKKSRLSAKAMSRVTATVIEMSN